VGDGGRSGEGGNSRAGNRGGSDRNDVEEVAISAAAAKRTEQVEALLRTGGSLIAVVLPQPVARACVSRAAVHTAAGHTNGVHTGAVHTPAIHTSDSHTAGSPSSALHTADLPAPNLDLPTSQNTFTLPLSPACAHPHPALMILRDPTRFRFLASHAPIPTSDSLCAHCAAHAPHGPRCFAPPADPSPSRALTVVRVAALLFRCGRRAASILAAAEPLEPESGSLVNHSLKATAAAAISQLREHSHSEIDAWRLCRAWRMLSLLIAEVEEGAEEGLGQRAEGGETTDIGRGGVENTGGGGTDGVRELVRRLRLLTVGSPRSHIDLAGANVDSAGGRAD
jgi:hypothetical protein